jgi:hypothetical protein
MNTAAIASMLLTALVAGQQPGVESVRTKPEEDLTARIVRLTGEAPEDCGRLMAPGNWGRPAYQLADLNKPIECAMRAAQARKPFFVVLRTLGFDSWTASGLLGSSDGVIRRLLYDNLYDQPNLRTQVCGTPTARVNADGFVFIHCDAIKQQ